MFSPALGNLTVDAAACQGGSSKRLGLAGMIALTFDADFAALPAEAFPGKVLSRRVGVSAVVAGYGLGLARAGVATRNFSKAKAERLGFRVEIVERIAWDEAGSLDAVSSTATREALERGDVGLARRLLGRPYFVEGEVVKGAQRGRMLGFPTANIALDPSNRLRYGVYAVTLETRGTRHRRRGELRKAPDLRRRAAAARGLRLRFRRRPLWRDG